MDSNNDGYGDLKGMISKLDYLKDLGVDVIWLSPVYQSPMDDNGYDISDYYAIDPIFGTLDDMKNLIHETHIRKMRIIMDLVVNHTSDEHVWFKEAVQSKNSSKRDFYIWADEPSDIGSVFGGSAWEFSPVTNQYYFHLFSKKQPDLNWDNPKLRAEIYKMINYWLDLGIDGFRLDVIDLIGKDVMKKQLSDGPFLKERLTEMNLQCFKGRDIMTVGEMPGISIEKASEFTNTKNPLLSMIFQFAHVGLDEIPGQGKWMLKKLDLLEFKQVFESLQTKLYQKGWNSLFLANHDQPRAVSRYGDLAYRKESAKMLSTILYGMQGTPYVYQGEEIGMTGIKFQNIEQYRDIETINIYHILKDQGFSEEKVMESIYAKGRDNSRTPFQWNSTKNAGFTQGIPWLDVNPNYPVINAQSDQKDPSGVYQYFKKLLSIRKEYDVFHQGNFVPFMKNHPELFGYYRTYQNEKILVIGSFSNKPIDITIPEKIHECLITNDPLVSVKNQMTLSPYYTCILKIGDEVHVNH